jgi:hypothetical protein
LREEEGAGMVSTNQKMQFIDGLTDELTTHRFNGVYRIEADLHPGVVAVVKGYVAATPCGGNVVVRTDGLNTITAFGRGYGPDIAIMVDDQPFIAIELKLLRDHYGVQRGVGQAVINSALYEYGIVFGLDKRAPNQKHEFDQYLSSSLWDHYRIKLVVRS